MDKVIPTCFIRILQRYNSKNINENNISMTDYFIKLHRIVFEFSGNSNKTQVEKTEQMFQTLIKNYQKINQKSILFQCLTYFVDNGFDLFMQILKAKETIKADEFHNQLLEVLDSEKIASIFHTNKLEIEKICNFECFKKAVRKMKMKYKNKLGLFILFFFREMIEAKDETILEEVRKFLKNEEIKNFYEIFDKEIDPNSAETKVNGMENGIKKDYSQKEEKKTGQNDIKTEFNEDKQQQMEDSSNKKKKDYTDIKELSDSYKNDKAFENTENSSIQKKGNKEEDINILDNKESILISLRKELNEFKSTSEKEICELKSQIVDLKKKVNYLENNVGTLNEKLDLSILINSVVAQRDAYKKSLEEMIKFCIQKYNLKVTITSTEIWRQAKEICLKILDLKEIELELKEKIVNGLSSLLFCKDYINCLIHGKGKFSGSVKKVYDETQKIIIPVASYSNMKEMTPKFFGSIVNKNKEFEIINTILLEKMKKWDKQKEFDYSKYFKNNMLNVTDITNDFNSAIEIMEKYNISSLIENCLNN